MCKIFLKVGEKEDGEAVVLTELLTAVMSGNTKALGSLVDRVKEGEVCESFAAFQQLKRHCCQLIGHCCPHTS